jgi:hypothetical protein
VANPIQISLVFKAPSGTCSPGGPDQQVVSTGAIWSCQNVNAQTGNGTWTDIGSGSQIYPALGIPSSSGAAWNSSYLADNLNNAGIQTSPVQVECGTGTTSPVLSTFSAGGIMYVFPDNWPSSCTAVTKGCTTNFDCAMGWAVQQDTAGTQPCYVYEIMLSNRIYYSNRGFVDNSSCTTNGYSNHGVGIIGTSWTATLIYASSASDGGFQQSYWFQSKNSVLPSGAQWRDFSTYTPATYVADYGCIALAGIEHVSMIRVHCNGFSNGEVDNIRRFNLQGWAPAHIDFGGFAGGNSGAGNYENSQEEVGTETDTQVFFPFSVTPTISTSTLTRPTGYNSTTETWNNAITGLTNVATCGAEGYDYGTGSSPCTGKPQHTLAANAYYPSNYIDASGLGPVVASTIPTVYTFPPIIKLYGQAMKTVPDRVSKRYSTVPNRDRGYPTAAQMAPRHPGTRTSGTCNGMRAERSPRFSATRPVTG